MPLESDEMELLTVLLVCPELVLLLDEGGSEGRPRLASDSTRWPFAPALSRRPAPGRVWAATMSRSSSASVAGVRA